VIASAYAIHKPSIGLQLNSFRRVQSNRRWNSASVADRNTQFIAKANAAQKLSRAATQKLLAGAVVQSRHAFSNYIQIAGRPHGIRRYRAIIGFRAAWRLNLTFGRNIQSHQNQWTLMDINSAILSAFESLTPNIKSIHSDASKYTLSDWQAFQSTLVTASGAASASIPGFHIAGMAADVVFLMNRMSTCAYGIGAIIGNREGVGDILEDEDFAIILSRWAGAEGGGGNAINLTPWLVRHRKSIGFSSFFMSLKGAPRAL
jgi:hypothetical protein